LSAEKVELIATGSYAIQIEAPIGICSCLGEPDVAHLLAFAKRETDTSTQNTALAIFDRHKESSDPGSNEFLRS